MFIEFRSHCVPGYYCSQPGVQDLIIVSLCYRRSVEEVLLLCQALWQAGYHILAFEYSGHGVLSLPAGVSLPLALGYREVKLVATTYARSEHPAVGLGP
ncbi:hypothetical protein [Thermogemmatispora sp.]|uniref:hypothetical protein n=1 Tax=Thermogemmatispora sp. TaxID=1968838 RepID=UPI0035E423D2